MVVDNVIVLGDQVGLLLVDESVLAHGDGPRRDRLEDVLNSARVVPVQVRDEILLERAVAGLEFLGEQLDVLGHARSAG